MIFIGNGHALLRISIVVPFVALALVACGRETPKQTFEATNITGVKWGRDFQLRDHSGKPRTLADFRGKVVMLFLGFTNYPDICLTTLAKMAQAVDRLGGDGRRVQGLFVTLDPKRDSPEVLRKYVTAFNPDFLGLYGDANQIAATAREFKVYYAAQPSNDQGTYTVAHQSAIFAFDSEGRLRLLFGADTSVDTVVHDLKILLSG